MSFKENLLRKIQIDETVKKLAAGIGTPDSGLKIDKTMLRGLLETGPRKFRKERDLELYVLENTNILVLDNELALYKTTPEDVALRKSPTVKEMVNIRNIFKILNDKDVIVSKREDSLETVRKECIAMLDLSFDIKDLEGIEADGIASLKREYADGVVESLLLFRELLGYVPAPKAFQISNHYIIGKSEKKDSGELLFGPAVIYSFIHNSLKLIDKQISSFSKDITAALLKTEKSDIQDSSQDISAEAHGCTSMPLPQGAAVFAYLREEAVTRLRA
ncbi:MAG: hypothetical protein BWK80_06580 [Desulfobacteraceae bacterium IS3]|nr:MAG: hypothetical protein BWK80_06580 [Desulfobacteraceae bacterium IS3]